MADKIDIWMPLFIGDYLSDTADLTAEQHGCYLLLLMHEWKNGPLPGDLESLAMIAHLGASRTRKRTVNFILTRYFLCSEDSNSAHTYTQKRLEAERQKSIEKQRFFEERASKGGRAKAALSSASSSASSTSQAVLEGVLETCTARPSSPSPSDNAVVSQPALVNQDNSVVVPTSAPRSKKPERNAGATPLGSLPCVGGRNWHFFQSDVDEWQRTYGAVDVIQELREMKQWLKANSLKTHRGMRRFIIHWLGNEQDRGPRKEGNRGYKPFNRAQANLDSTVQSGLTAIAEINEFCDPVDQAGGTVRRTNGHEGSTPSVDGRGVVGSPSGRS